MFLANLKLSIAPILISQLIDLSGYVGIKKCGKGSIINDILSFIMWLTNSSHNKSNL